MRRALALGVPLAFLAAACTYNNGDARRVLDNSQPASCSTPTQSTIDTDQQIAIDAGQGAGVFIEYASGGHYKLSVACDTARGSSSCNWDVIVSPDVGKTLSLTGFTGISTVSSFLAPANQPDQSLNFEFSTTISTEINDITFDTEPGAAVTVDAFLDGTCALPFFFWFGDGALHSGSPSNPLTLTPSAE